MEELVREEIFGGDARSWIVPEHLVNAVDQDRRRGGAVKKGRELFRRDLRR